MPARLRFGSMQTLKCVVNTCLALLILAGAPASAAAAQTSIGIEPFYFWGHHYEPGNNLGGAAPGFFADLRHRAGRFELKVEGVPAISAHSTTTSALGIPESQSISVLDSDLRYYVDGEQRVFVSLGEALLTQTTPWTASAHTDSRVVGGRYGVGSRFALARSIFFESQFVLMPHLHGLVSYREPAHVVPLSPAAEMGSNVEFEGAVGMRRGRAAYLAGVHSTNYAAHFADGTPADQIVAVGVFGEFRYLFGRR